MINETVEDKIQSLTSLKYQGISVFLEYKLESVPLGI